MKTLFTAVTLFVFTALQAQYYYKDIIGTKESADLIISYRNNKVRTVALNTYTVNNTPIDNFSIQQEFLPAQQALRTITRSDYTGTSFLTSFVDATGRVVKTLDSVGGMVNTTLYNYNIAGNLVSVLFTAGDTLTALKTDDHLWQYDAQNRVRQMLRIKNKRDTAIVSFKLDEHGNVVEEQERRRAISDEPYYYYYDASNRLTDIVRFNKKASRLLPEQMFEYSTGKQVIQRISVPQNSDDYLIWRFAYDNRGLKTKEVVFNKQKEQTGKVEYVYTFSN